MKPTVSVVTRGRPELRRCVEALMALDYPTTSLQIIVVADGGPDPDLAGLGAGPELTVLQQSNRGPFSTRPLIRPVHSGPS